MHFISKDEGIEERTLIMVVLRVAYLQVQRGHTVPAAAAVSDDEEEGDESSPKSVELRQVSNPMS